MSDWFKSKWAFIVEAFGVIVGAFLYEQKRANKADAKVQVADESKVDAILETQQQDVAERIKEVEATPPPAPKTLEELAKELGSK